MTLSDSFDTVLEAALHAHVMRRCERAYLHELRDGLQGVAVSVDAMSRVIAGKAPAALSGDKVVQIARRALQSHEQALEQVVRELAMSRDVVRVDVSELLHQIAKLLRNDAAVREITINVSTDDQVPIDTVAGGLKLLLLSIVTHAIDTLQGGEIGVSVNRDDEVVAIRFALKPAAPMADSSFGITDGDAHDLSFLSSPNWVLDAARRVARAAGGDIDIAKTVADGRAGCVVRLKYQARKLSGGISSG